MENEVATSVMLDYEFCVEIDGSALELVAKYFMDDGNINVVGVNALDPAATVFMGLYYGFRRKDKTGDKMLHDSKIRKSIYDPERGDLELKIALSDVFVSFATVAEIAAEVAIQSGATCVILDEALEDKIAAEL